MKTQRAPACMPAWVIHVHLPMDDWQSIPGSSLHEFYGLRLFNLRYSCSVSLYIILYSRLHIPILKSIISIVWESPHWRAHTLNHGHALANSLCEGTIHYKLHTIGVLSTRQVNCLLLNCLLHAHAWDIVHILLYWTRLDEGILDTEINSPSHLSCNLWPRAFPTLQCTGA